jgi:uncharacterized OsmC-like protein
LASSFRGEIGLEGKVLVIRRIHVSYKLKVTDEQRETAEKVHGFHADYCPMARTIKDCVEVTTSLELETI